MSKAKPYEDVEIASRSDLEEGAKRALKGLGMTYEQLAEAAKQRRFPSERARAVWFMISPADGAVC